MSCGLQEMSISSNIDSVSRFQVFTLIPFTLIYFSLLLISESVHCYSNLLSELEQIVMRMALESYGIENDFHIGSATFLIRFLKYRVPKMNETSISFPPHTDKSFISILHQNQVNGLEIETKDGKWIRYEHPSLLVFLVMVGKAFMVSH